MRAPEITGVHSGGLSRVLRDAVYLKIRDGLLPEGGRAWSDADTDVSSRLSGRLRLVAREVAVTRTAWKRAVSRVSRVSSLSESTLIRMSLCRPAGVWLDRALPHVCRKWRFCPFCFYRKVQSFIHELEGFSARTPVTCCAVIVARGDGVIPAMSEVYAVNRRIAEIRASRAACWLHGMKYFRPSVDGRWAVVAVVFSGAYSTSVLPPGAWAEVSDVVKAAAKVCPYPWQLLSRRSSPEDFAGLLALSAGMRAVTTRVKARREHVLEEVEYVDAFDTVGRPASETADLESHPIHS